MTEQPAPPKKRRIPPWRWAWMGFGLAAVLWFGSSVYFQRIHQMAEIDYEVGGIEEADYVAMTERNIRNAMMCKVAAGILSLASLTYLVSQVKIHRPRPRY